ncbi:hypothetical protein GF342_04400 [Candidatus Woesearchaeota archaeon]|nr:hypothetical protein [Candidatus Woesearchaeota archaeon]
MKRGILHTIGTVFALSGLIALTIMLILTGYSPEWGWFFIGLCGLGLLILVVFLMIFYALEFKIYIHAAAETVHLIRILLNRAVPIISLLAFIAYWILFLVTHDRTHIWNAGYTGVFILFTFACNLALRWRKPLVGIDYL